MEKVVNYTVPKNNTFCQFYSITMFGVVFYHPSALTESQALEVWILRPQLDTANKRLDREQERSRLEVESLRAEFASE